MAISVDLIGKTKPPDSQVRDNYKTVTFNILDREEYFDLMDILLGLLQDKRIPKKHRNAIKDWVKHRMSIGRR